MKTDERIAFYADMGCDPPEIARYVGKSEEYIEEWLAKRARREERAKQLAERAKQPKLVLPRDLKRTFPSDEMADEERENPRFVPAPDVRLWLFQTFLDPYGPLYNPDHEHLAEARIGVLWTNKANNKGGLSIAGTAEMPNLRGNAWIVGRAEQQLREWFEEIPDFILTFDTVYAARASNATWCARVEHELYHCSQRLTREGEPAFDFDDRPLYFLRDHDVNEFLGVMRRYRPEDASANVAEFIRLAGEEPEVEAAEILGACGYCLR